MDSGWQPKVYSNLYVHLRVRVSGNMGRHNLPGVVRRPMSVAGKASSMERAN